MSQNSDVLLPTTRYTRADFTALRAHLNRLPAHQISSLYYAEDDLEDLGCSTPNALLARLEGLRDRLILRASEKNPNLAELLRSARQKQLWSAKVIDFLVQAAEDDMAVPRRQDSLAAWFKPRLAAVLRAEQVRNLGELMALIAVRGAGWWRPVPRIGVGKAARLEAWLGQHAASLGELLRQPLPVLSGELVLLSPDTSRLVPIERALLPSALDGHDGVNRNERFCQIAARNDYQAIEAYLTKFRHQEKTRRAYQKEIERFLLWCITVRKTALSSTLQGDCEAFKDFLRQIPAAWLGPRRPRSDPRWRPFVGPLSPASQRYAVQAIRFFFNWLVDVRYLGGNPWATVGDPAVARSILPLQIDKALSTTLWDRLSENGGILDQLSHTDDDSLRLRYKLRGATAKLSMSAQFRLVRAALLLIGDTGLRREEATYATRDKLKPLTDADGLWELDVLGKRNRWRTVFPSPRAIAALQAHWADRGSDFSFAMVETPLLSPLSAPGTRTAALKHRDKEGQMRDQGFSGDGLYRVIKTALRRIAADDGFSLSDEERAHLRQAAPHALRHTFGTQAAAGEVPLDVIQKVLGHASLQTTTIYVQAEKQRSITELGKFLINPNKRFSDPSN